MGLELFEEQVGRDLGHDVRDEEDGEGSTKLNAGELEVLCETKDGRIVHVHTVQIRQYVTSVRNKERAWLTGRGRP
jgi:hypothetical protein